MMRCLPYLRQPGTLGSIFDIPASKSSYSKSGSVGKIYVIPPKSKHYTKFNICSLDWIYEVYYEIENHKEQRLIKELSKRIPILKDVLSSLDTFRSTEWYEQLLNEISDLVKPGKVRITDIQKDYEKVFGTNHNPYSMLVFSHAASDKYKKYSCLYTGDAEAKTVINSLQFFDPRYIQVPHHGSSHNYNPSIYLNRPIVFISVGQAFPYGHPGQATLVGLLQKCCFTHIVTEDSNTKYQKEFPL